MFIDLAAIYNHFNSFIFNTHIIPTFATRQNFQPTQHMTLTR